MWQYRVLFVLSPAVLLLITSHSAAAQYDRFGLMVTGPDPDASVGHSRERFRLFRGAPVRVDAFLSKESERVDAGPPVFEGVKFELGRLARGAVDPIEVEFFSVPDKGVWGESKGYPLFMGVWYCFVDPGPGHYVLRARAPDGLVPEDRSVVELEFEIVPTRSARDRARVAWSVVRAYMDLGRFEEAEKVALAIEDSLGTGYVPLEYLARIYVGMGDNERAFDCLKKYVRKRTARRGPGSRGCGDTTPALFCRLAVETGEAETQEQAVAQYHEFVLRAASGEGVEEPRRWKRLVLWGLAAVLALGAAIILVIVRRRLRRSRVTLRKR